MSADTEYSKINQEMYCASDSGLSDLSGKQGSDDEFGTNTDSSPVPQPSLPTFSNLEQDGIEYNTTLPTGKNEYMQGTSDTFSSITPQQLPSFKRRKQTKEEDGEGRQHLQQKRQLNDDINTEDSHQAILDKVAKIFDKAMEWEANQGKKKKRKKVLDNVALQHSKHKELSNLCKRMKIAAETDIIANEQQKPAIAKLKMLDEVATILSSSSLYDGILDNQLLDAIRVWLEPLPDHGLPSVHLQNEMLDILDKLSSFADHLRESGIAKIVNFYKISTRVEGTVQRKADHLVAKWTRLVLQSSEHHHEIQEYNKDNMSHKRKRLRLEDVGTGFHKTRSGVSIPTPAVADYDVAPRGTVRSRKSQSLPKNHPHRRLKKKMRSLRQNSSQTSV